MISYQQQQQQMRFRPGHLYRIKTTTKESCHQYLAPETDMNIPLIKNDILMFIRKIRPHEQIYAEKDKTYDCPGDHLFFDPQHAKLIVFLSKS